MGSKRFWWLHGFSFVALSLDDFCALGRPLTLRNMVGGKSSAVPCKAQRPGSNRTI
jgi:hypothetical protein